MATENNVGAAPGTLGSVVRNCFAVDVGIVDTDNMTTHWKEVARYDDRETAERVAQLNRCEIRIREVAGWWNCQKHGQTPAKCRCGAATAFVPNAAGEVRRNAVTSTGLLADESKGAGQ